MQHIYKLTRAKLTIWHGDETGKLVSVTEVRPLKGRKMDRDTAAEKLREYEIELPADSVS